MHDVDPDVPPEPAPLAVLLLLVALGGALGSLARYWLVEAFPDLVTTFAINVSGSFALAVLVARRPHGRWSRPFLGTGVLGGFTTFSAFAVQTVDASLLTAIAYVTATVALGIAAASLGVRVAR